MYNFFRQNKHILLVAAGVFIVSMTALLLFLNTENKSNADLNTDVLSSDANNNDNSESHYRDLFQNQSDPIVVVGLDGHINFTSWNYEAVTGFTSQELKGQLFFSLINSEDLPAFFSAFGKVVETGKPQSAVGPFRIIDKDGNYHTSMGSVYPVIEQNKVTMIGIVAKDISSQLEQGQQDATPQDSAPGDPGTSGTYQQKSTIPLYRTIQQTKTIKPSTQPQQTTPVTPWKKPKSLRENDPSWVAGDRLVMLFPFKLPLFPAHLLLAQL